MYQPTREAYRTTPRLSLATVVASTFFLGTAGLVIDKVSHTNTMFQVFTDGRYVGMVPNEPNVTVPMTRLAQGYRVNLSFYPIRVAVPSSYQWQAVASLPMASAAISLNGKPLVYTSSVDDAQAVLSTVQQALVPQNVASDAQVAFVGNVTVSPAVVSVANILSPDAAVRYLLNPGARGEVGRSESSLLPGQVFAAFPGQAEQTSPLLQVDTVETLPQHVQVPYPVHYMSDNYMALGEIHVVKAGKPGLADERIQYHFINGKLVAEKVMSKHILTQPKVELARRGSNAGIATGAWVWPTASYVITSPFGWRDLNGWINFHPGIDIGCPIGTPIYASNNGVVEDAGWNSGGYGIWVRINNGNGIETVFGHCSSVVVHPGEMVAKGQVIAYSGETGEATGPHLHYEVRIGGRAVPPTPYM